MDELLPEWIRKLSSQVNGGSNNQARSPLYSSLDEESTLLMLNNLAFGEEECVNELILQQMLPEVICEQLVDYPFIQPPDEDIFGAINLGYCEDTGAPAGIFSNEVHTLITGASSSGKSTLFKNIIRQHLGRIPVLIFDFENEYPELLKDDSIIVLGIDDLKWNPLQPPPGMDPILYSQMFCSIFADQCGLLIASKSFLLKAIDHLYTLSGVYEGKNTFPSFYELREYLERACQKFRGNSRFMQYAEVCLNRTEGFIRALPKVLDCSVGMPLNLLTRGNTVLLLHGVDFEYSALMVTLILSWLCCHRIANGLRNNPEHNLAVFVDEAQRLFDAQLERRLHQGIPTISQLAAQVRKYNLKLFVAAQQPTMVASSIKANSFCKVMLSLREGSDIMDMGTSMFLTPEQTYFSRGLETGQAIVKFSGRWTEPFIIRIPYEE